MKEMVLRRIGLLLIGAPLSKHSIITEINFAPVKISHSMLQCQVITLEENLFSLCWTWLFTCQENSRSSDHSLDDSWQLLVLYLHLTGYFSQGTL